MISCCMSFCHQVGNPNLIRCKYPMTKLLRIVSDGKTSDIGLLSFTYIGLKRNVDEEVGLL